MEIWKIISKNTNYKISNLGRVKSIDRIDSIGRNRKGKNIVLSDNSNGYLKCGLGRSFPNNYVHRLVAIEFLNDGLDTELHVNHKNGIKHDNRLDNLELVTRSENDLHKKRNLEWHRFPVIDLETGIFYANSQDVYETFNDTVIKVKKSGWKEYVSGRRDGYKRFRYA